MISLKERIRQTSSTNPVPASNMNSQTSFWLKTSKTLKNTQNVTILNIRSQSALELREFLELSLQLSLQLSGDVPQFLRALVPFLGHVLDLGKILHNESWYMNNNWREECFKGGAKRHQNWKTFNFPPLFLAPGVWLTYFLNCTCVNFPFANLRGDPPDVPGHRDAADGDAGRAGHDSRPAREWRLCDLLTNLWECF